MSQSRVPQAYTIMIHCHRAIHHLVQSITVEVGHIQRVVTLTGISTMLFAILACATIISVEAPTLRELSVTPVPRLNDAVTVDATSQHYRRQSRLIETAYSHAKGAGTFPVTISPGLTGLAVNEVVTGQLTTSLTVDDTEKLWSCRVIMVQIARFRRIQIAPRTVVYLPITFGVRNLRAIAKYRALTSADSHLGTTVTIKVGHGKTG